MKPLKIQDNSRVGERYLVNGNIYESNYDDFFVW